MILQPGGAMALFVLRLAGLLSLEKSLGENSTDTSLNLTDTTGDLNISFPFPNFPNVTTDFPLPDYDWKNNTDFYSARETWVNVTPDSLFEVENVNDFKSKGVAATVAAVDNDDASLVRLGLHDITKEGTPTNGASLNVSTDDIKRKGGMKLFVQKRNNVSNKYTSANVEKIAFVSPNVNQEPPHSITTEAPNIDIIIGFDPTDRYHSSPSSSSILESRNSDTGFSPVFTKPINNTAMLLFTHLVPATSLVTTPRIMFLASSSRQPPAEGANDNLREMHAVRTDFVTSDLDYFDLEDFERHQSSDPDPDLSSRSLISPVPQPGQEKSFIEYLKNEVNKNGEMSNRKIVAMTDKGSGNISNETDFIRSIGGEANALDRNNTSEAKAVKSETFIKRGVGLLPTETDDPARTAIPVRNNPYPYGPKILPDHVLKYNPNLKPKELPQILGSFFPDQNFLFDYDGVTDEDKDKGEATVKQDQRNKDGETDKDNKFFVKTEKPPVLFHFDKPGYSPKLPDASLPPTRAPTPSDPWDCSPRCPRYSLLDWNQDYDIRQYPVTTWISTVIIAENRILAELEGYMRVQDYFYGLNDRGQLLNMTIPFVTQIKHGRHPGVLKEFKDFTVSLYVNHIDDPLNYDLPTPISNEVLIDRLETKTVFVAGFEANVWEVTEFFLNEKVSILMEKLRQNGEAFLDRYFYLSSYSRPELYQPVYYELWIYATSFRDNVITTPPMAPRARPPPNKITIKSISKLCRGVECPPFEVLRTYRYGIQKRRYFDGLFVTTSPGECEFTTLSVWKGFMPLHLYKHGINSHMEVIEATRPIGLVHVKEDSTSITECPQNMTMAIYLPKRLHSNPPLTGYDAPSVSINALQDVVVYAYTVGGYLLEPQRVRKELSDLKHRLTEFGACFKRDEYYMVVYDFIIRYHGRQNEIWIVAENCKATLNG